MPKDTIPTSFSCASDLVSILDELNTQASAVFASVFVINNLYPKYAESTDPVRRNDYAVILREHGVALETYLGIIKLDAGLVTDERLEMWVSADADEVEKEARTTRLDTLMRKLVDLEEAMAELREGFVGDADFFL